MNEDRLSHFSFYIAHGSMRLRRLEIDNSKGQTLVTGKWRFTNKSLARDAENFINMILNIDLGSNA